MKTTKIESKEESIKTLRKIPNGTAFVWSVQSNNIRIKVRDLNTGNIVVFCPTDNEVYEATEMDLESLVEVVEAEIVWKKLP